MRTEEAGWYVSLKPFPLADTPVANNNDGDDFKNMIKGLNQASTKARNIATMPGGLATKRVHDWRTDARICKRVHMCISVR